MALQKIPRSIFIFSLFFTLVTPLLFGPVYAREGRSGNPEVRLHSDTVEIFIESENIKNEAARFLEASQEARDALAEELEVDESLLELISIQRRKEVIEQFDEARDAINWLFTLDRSQLDKLEELYEEHSEELEDIRFRLRNLEEKLIELVDEKTVARIMEEIQFGLDRIRKLISRDKIKQAKKELAGLEYFWLVLESFSEGDYAKAHNQLLEGKQHAGELVDQYVPVILEKIRESGGRIFDYLPAVEIKFDTPAER